MELLDLYINGFGKFHERSITFKNGLNVVYGKNEAGKSTLHTFIRGMLFGIERGRGRASKSDLYTKYEPWENSANYEGRLRLKSGDMIYRIERKFHKNSKNLKIINETLGQEESPDKQFFDKILGGLTETSYNNTISISQLKSATDNNMVSELKNYIANLNTSGSMALNITKAALFLKNQRKELESQIVQEAARSYASLLGEIRNIEGEISSPEFENQLSTYERMRADMKSQIEEKQEEKEALTQKITRGRQILSSNQFTDMSSITAYSDRTKKVYSEHQQMNAACQNKSRTVLAVFAFILAAALAGAAGYLNLTSAGLQTAITYHLSSLITLEAPLGGFLVFLIVGCFLLLKGKRYKKELVLSTNLLQEVFSRHLGDNSISEEAMDAFIGRMSEFTRLSTALTQSETALRAQLEEIAGLQEQQNSYCEVIEKQQRIQWELEKKLEHLASAKDNADALKHILTENDRLRDEISSIDLALETMTELSTSIRASFGLHLNKTSSKLIAGITDGIYSSMSVDENLNIFMNTRTKLVPIEQVSSGAMDQIYLALRLATAKLIQGDSEPLPLIFDDSFVQYDDERLCKALKWLSKAYDSQIIIFTCHQREIQILNTHVIPHHMIVM